MKNRSLLVAVFSLALVYVTGCGPQGPAASTAPADGAAVTPTPTQVNPSETKGATTQGPRNDREQ